MHHDVFGEISYSRDHLEWTGSCALPVFAEYQVLDIEPEVAGGVLPLTIQDDTGAGPS